MGAGATGRDGDRVGRGVLDRVGDRFAGDEPGSLFDIRGKAFLRHLDVDWDRRAGGEFVQRRGQATIGPDRWTEAVGEFAQVSHGLLEFIDGEGNGGAHPVGVVAEFRRAEVHGEAKESLPIPFGGEPLEIGFNPEFFRDGLESAESDDLVLKLISPLRPGLIQSGDDGGFVYLVMPIRLNV